MTEREALKLAMKDLERAESTLHKARAAIKETLSQPEQEPVAFKCGDAIVHIKPPVYGATPPQRKPLRASEVWDAYMQISAEFDCNVIDLVEFARAIEAAHGIKENT